MELIGRHLERAVRSSVFGRPGPTYIGCSHADADADADGGAGVTL